MLYATIAICSIVITYLVLRPKLNNVKELNSEIEQQNLKLENQNQFLQKECNELTHTKTSIQSEITFLKTQKFDTQENIKALQSQAQQSADIFYKQAMNLASERLDIDLNKKESQFQEAEKQAQEAYIKALEEYKDSFQKTIKEKQEEFAELTAELADLQSKTNSAIEAAKRQQEIEQKIDFYRIQISEDEKNEINAILSIKHLISNKRNLYMLIWSSYYSKRVNELAVRVLGNNAVCGIYRITNIKTQQSYIGQSKDIRERWREHVKASLGIDTPGANKLYTNTIKYGIENFTFELLEECLPIELDVKEKYWIEFYDTYNNGLNSNRGNSKSKEY